MSIQRSKHFGSEAVRRSPRFRPRPKWCPLGNAHNPRYGAAERRQRIPRAITRRSEYRWSPARAEEREDDIVENIQTMRRWRNILLNIWEFLFPPYKPAKIDPNIYHIDTGGEI